MQNARGELIKILAVYVRNMCIISVCILLNSSRMHSRYIPMVRCGQPSTDRIFTPHMRGVGILSYCNYVCL